MNSKRFQTYNPKGQHFNISGKDFPKLLAYLDSLDTSIYDSPEKKSGDRVRDIVHKTVNEFFSRPHAKIELPYNDFKPLADEYARVFKVNGEPNYIPVIIKSNGRKISITYQ